MLNDPTKINFIYATTVSGQIVKIVLPGSVDEAYITQKLMEADSTVTKENLNYTSFSLTPPAPFDPKQLELIHNKTLVIPPSLPDFPAPRKELNGYCAAWSKLLVKEYVSFADLATNNAQFCMQRIDNGNLSYYLNVLNIDKSWFVNGSDYDDLHSGNIGLLHGIAWQNMLDKHVKVGEQYNLSRILTSGFKDTTQYSISATVGASGAGLSASLTVTFGQTFETSEEKTFSFSDLITGQPGVVYDAVLWQLTDLIYVVRYDPITKEYVFINSYELQMDNSQVVDSGSAFTMKTDPNFFGNSDYMDDGNQVVTKIIQPTEKAIPNTNIVNS